MFPHCLSRRGDIKIPGHIGLGPSYLDARALVLLLPRVFEVAQPELNVANDVDGFVMLDESLRRRVDAHSLDAGVAVERICAAANLLAHRVLEEPMDENHFASCKLFTSAHLLLHHLAVMDDELEIKIAHRNAGFALADRGLFDVAQTPTELEIGRLNSILQERAVDLLGYRVDESGIALKLGKSEGRPEALDRRVHEIGDDVLRVVEFDPGQEARIAGDIGYGEIGQFRFRKHRISPQKTSGTRSAS
jgi:hypothetical protein